jgi:hypothetical protein
MRLFMQARNAQAWEFEEQERLLMHLDMLKAAGLLPSSAS